MKLWIQLGRKGKAVTLARPLSVTLTCYYRHRDRFLYGEGNGTNMQKASSSVNRKNIYQWNEWFLRKVLKHMGFRWKKCGTKR
jgi:hypothetical protein